MHFPPPKDRTDEKMEEAEDTMFKSSEPDTGSNINYKWLALQYGGAILILLLSIVVVWYFYGDAIIQGYEYIVGEFERLRDLLNETESNPVGIYIEI